MSNGGYIAQNDKDKKKKKNKMLPYSVYKSLIPK